MFLINPYILGGGAVVNPLWDGLQAYYTADNTPNDALGTYNGTLTNGATYGTGIISNGFSLDGVNDYIDLGNNLDFDGSTPFSFSAWVYINTGTGIKTIISKMSNVLPSTGYLFFVNNRVLQVILRETASTNEIYNYSSSTAVPVTSWCHCMVTYDGSKNASGMKLYVNGILNNIIFTDNFTGSSSNTNSANIGARFGSDFFMNGLVDEVGVWDRELSASEVTELYNSGAGKQYPN